MFFVALIAFLDRPFQLRHCDDVAMWLLSDDSHSPPPSPLLICVCRQALPGTGGTAGLDDMAIESKSSHHMTPPPLPATPHSLPPNRCSSRQHLKVGGGGGLSVFSSD